MTKIELLKMTDDKLDTTVKIQGTQYDRKRKVTDKLVEKMLKMAKRKDYKEIASELGLTYRTVRYHTEPLFRSNYIKGLSGKHTGKDKITMTDRVAYKRELVAAGKIGA